MHGLTSAHGTVLCYDRTRRGVTHKPPAEVAAVDLVFIPDLNRPAFGVIGSAGEWLAVDVGTPGPSRSTLPRHPELVFRDGHAAFRFETGYLSLSPHGSIRMDVAEARDWELFGLVEQEALRGVLALCRTDWVRIDTRERIRRGDTALASRREVRIGAHVYPIAGNLPVHSIASGRRRNLFFRDGWKVDAFVAYGPLVYFVLMGAGAYADQLRLAAASLLEFGQYDGDILVITDRDRSLIEQAFPASSHARLSILSVASSDKVDAVLARLMLSEHPQASGYAPILYADTDVIFDRPLAPFLEHARLATLMSAQSEPWNVLPGSECCGAELFGADPTPIRQPIGFNAGVWVMPGGPDSLDTVDAVRRAITAYLHSNGRDSLPWLDQAMANYVLRKLDAFDPRPMTEAVRLAQSYEDLSTDDRRGFVHFWPAALRADERTIAMADYVTRLRNGADGPASLPVARSAEA